MSKLNHLNNRFKSTYLPLNDLILIERLPISDDRGYLERLFCRETLAEIIDNKTLVQINHTLTHKTGTVRGMHYQIPPYGEVKMVSCIRGEIFDVAVDLRAKSNTFLKWHGEYLSEKNHKTLIIPEGFAHGFQTIQKGSEVLYFHTAAYNPSAETGLHPQDPLLSINWPLHISELSQKDSEHTFLQTNFAGITL